LLNDLPGFTTAHLRTDEERVVVALAKDELNQRNTRRMRCVSWIALGVSVVSAGGAIASAFAAWFANR
jgi:hypothetical protein